MDAFSYVAQGTRSEDGTRTFDVDGLGRVVKLYDRFSPQTLAVRYDPLGRPLTLDDGVNVRTLQYFGADVVQEALNGPVTRQHTIHPALGRIATHISGDSYQQLYDARQNLIATLDSAGALRELLRYDDFGHTTITSISSTGLEPMFGGMRGLQFPGTAFGPIPNWPGSLYLGMFRLYDEANGVWLSQDPLQYVDGPNMSAYVAQSPISATDPLGLNKRDSEIPSLEPIGAGITPVNAPPTRPFYINDLFGVWSAKVSIKDTAGKLVPGSNWSQAQIKESIAFRWALEDVANNLESSRGKRVLSQLFPSSFKSRMDPRAWLSTVDFVLLDDPKAEPGHGSKTSNTIEIGWSTLQSLVGTLRNYGNSSLSAAQRVELDRLGFAHRPIGFVAALDAILTHEVVHWASRENELTAYVVEDLLTPGVIDLLVRLDRFDAGEVFTAYGLNNSLSSEQFTFEKTLGGLFWNLPSSQHQNIVYPDFTRPIEPSVKRSWKSVQQLDQDIHPITGQIK